MVSSILLALAMVPTILLPAMAAPGAESAHKRSTVDIITNCAVSGQVAMSFDDGPYIYEADVAKNLGDNKGHFFLNGNNYDCIYNHVDEIRALHAAGHTLGSHTWSHPHLTSLTWDEIHDELWKVELAFERILGLRPTTFRPPYGEYNDLVISALENRGYKMMALWSDDTNDSNGATLAESEAVYDQIVSSYPAPHLVLEHSVKQPTAQQLVPYAVKKLKDVGYEIVAIDTCVGSGPGSGWPYVYIGEPQTQDSSWTC